MTTPAFSFPICGICKKPVILETSSVRLYSAPSVFDCFCDSWVENYIPAFKNDRDIPRGFSWDNAGHFQYVQSPLKTLIPHSQIPLHQLYN
jgi:hypothetical protein